MTQYARTQPPKLVFLAATVVIFFLTLSAAESVGFVPYYIDGTPPSHSDASDHEYGAEHLLALTDLPELGVGPAPVKTVNTTAGKQTTASTVKPVRIKIAAIDLDLPVQNPSTRDVDALDTLLQKGPARYVDSAHLGESGNMIIFGHSSHLPVVHNQMYKAFNRIPELKAGDRITVTGDNGALYVYQVKSLRRADAANTTLDMSASLGSRLTIVTCDTLTSKSARFVLEADLI